jgi:hypothetical protein
LLDFSNLSIHDLQPDRNGDIVSLVVIDAVIPHILFDAADHRDLLCFGIRYVEAIGAEARHAIPEPFVAERKRNPVLGEADVAREQVVTNVAVQHRFEVPIHVALKARAVAGRLFGRSLCN